MILNTEPPKKICFFTTEYAIPELGRSGGIGVFLKHHARALSNEGFRVHICSFADEAKTLSDGEIEITVLKDVSRYLEPLKERYRNTRLPGYISFKVLLSQINRKYISLKFKKYLKARQIDIIELNDYGGHPAYLRTKLPVVIRCHGSATVLHRFFGYSRRAVDIPFERILFKRYNKNIICVSEFSAKTTRDAFNLKQKPKVIYNGIAMPNLSPAFDNSYLEAPTIPFSIFYFGAIRERKGIDLAAKIFNSVIVEFPHASFHVSGSNNNKHWAEVENNILTKSALKATTYYGDIENSKIYGHLKKAHLVVFPSYGENFSMALLEVMGLGKLVITSDIPSFREIIEHKENGFIAKSDNDYIGIIKSIFKEKMDSDDISKNSINTIKERFSQEKIMKENIAYYNSVLE